jgi:hypothetical protein
MTIIEGEIFFDYTKESVTVSSKGEQHRFPSSNGHFDSIEASRAPSHKSDKGGSR